MLIPNIHRIRSQLIFAHEKRKRKKKEIIQKKIQAPRKSVTRSAHLKQVFDQFTLDFLFFAFVHFVTAFVVCRAHMNRNKTPKLSRCVHEHASSKQTIYSPFRGTLA